MFRTMRVKGHITVIVKYSPMKSGKGMRESRF
jgi:hypothetical protein